MSLDFSSDTSLNGRRTEPSAEYPLGTYKEQDTVGGVPVVNTGTPALRESILKDWDGVRQAVLAAGKITPDGDPDNVTDCEFLAALLTMYGKTITTRPGNATEATASNFGSAIIKSSTGSDAPYFQANAGPGTSYSPASELRSGGVHYTGNIPGDSALVVEAIAEYTIDTGDVSIGGTAGDYLLNYVPGATPLVLTGMPILTAAGDIIHSTVLKLIDSTGKLWTYPLSCQVYDGATWHQISTGTASQPSVSPLPTFVSGKLQVRYDPRYID